MTQTYIEAIQQELTPVEKINQIVEHAMCIGCGICQSISTPGTVKMEIAENGNFRPMAQSEFSEEDINRVLDICPGTRVDGLPNQLIDSQSQFDSVWGVWHEMFYSWSAEPEIRHMAATGGLLTGLALYLLETKEVNFVLHATEPKDHPSFGERWISRNRDEVLQGSGSRYGPTATLVDAVQIIEQAEIDKETFAFIGTPCDVSALRNLARHDSRVDRHCKFMFTMVCGGFMGAEGATTALAKFGVKYDEVASLRYRGYGCPGPTTIKTQEGETVEMNYLDYWGDDESTWGLPPRCKVCPDGIGDSADIAASDTWDGGSPLRQGQDNDLGFNGAIVRTRRGVELMSRAVEAGYLCRGDDLNPMDMNRVQPHQETKKRSVWARNQGLKENSQIFPQTTGLRIEGLYKENSEKFNKEQQQGTSERVKRGKFREFTPMKKQ